MWVNLGQESRAPWPVPRCLWCLIYEASSTSGYFRSMDALSLSWRWKDCFKIDRILLIQGCGGSDKGHPYHSSHIPPKRRNLHKIVFKKTKKKMNSTCSKKSWSSGETRPLFEPHSCKNHTPVRSPFSCMSGEVSHSRKDWGRSDSCTCFERPGKLLNCDVCNVNGVKESSVCLSPASQMCWSERTLQRADPGTHSSPSAWAALDLLSIKREISHLSV